VRQCGAETSQATHTLLVAICEHNLLANVHPCLGVILSVENHNLLVLKKGKKKYQECVVKIDLTFKGEFNNESPPVVMRPPKTPLLADIPQVFLYGCELCDWPLPTATRSTLRTASLLATGLFSTDYGVIALRKDSWNLYFVPSSLRSSFCCDFLAFCLRPLSLHFLFVFWISTLRFYLSVNVPSFSIMCFPM
jgi:hypothetical protein